MILTDAEKKKKEAEEEMRKLNEKFEGAEKEELKKLMTDLSIPFEGDPEGSSVSVNTQPESFFIPKNRIETQKTGTSELINSLSPNEHDLTDGSDRNPAHADLGSCIKIVTQDKQITATQMDFADDIKSSLPQIKSTQNMKGSSDAFAFLEEEFKFNRNTGSHVRQMSYSPVDKSLIADVIHNKDNSERFESDAVSSESKGGPVIQDSQNQKIDGVHNDSGLLRDADDPVIITPANNDNGRMKEHENEQSDVDMDDNFCVSSSPVF